GVVAALARDDNVHRLQLVDVFRILERRHFAADVRTTAAKLGRGEKYRLYLVEIALFAHALHEHRAHHATPSDETYSQHSLFPSTKPPVRAIRGRPCQFHSATAEFHYP